MQVATGTNDIMLATKHGLSIRFQRIRCEGDGAGYDWREGN